ncbi:MAG: hypothetical protein J7J25_05785 [Candidatus Omnitrophica bacterium]|nr:hypothetical protein [Candidatus Omnitrophota bacterium]
MRWDDFLNNYAQLPVIDTNVLLAGVTNPRALKVQLTRWVKAKKIIQAKRGVYVLADKYRKVPLYEPYLAFLLKKPSYISLEKALEYYGLIPEAVPVFTSLTTKRQAKFISAAGTFVYRHIKKALFWGYNSVTVNGQTGFIASPEKALLDLFYINRIKISFAFLKELRLQNIDKLDTKKLLISAERFKSPGILKAANTVNKYISGYKEEEKIL